MTLKERVQRRIDKLPYVRSLKRKLDKQEKAFFVGPGHYYSPYVNIAEIESNAEKIFKTSKVLYGIELNEKERFEFCTRSNSIIKRFPSHISQLSKVLLRQ